MIQTEAISIAFAKGRTLCKEPGQDFRRNPCSLILDFQHHHSTHGRGCENFNEAGFGIRFDGILYQIRNDPPKLGWRCEYKGIRSKGLGGGVYYAERAKGGFRCFLFPDDFVENRQEKRFSDMRLRMWRLKGF